MSAIDVAIFYIRSGISYKIVQVSGVVPAQPVPSFLHRGEGGQSRREHWCKWYRFPEVVSIGVDMPIGHLLPGIG